ncbi:PucR family transcriptional regulator [Nocardioides jiangxiensis]|uniref:Helix-turn-helix domain-containing protein n=1 Tax=Nocardioides jiangxiensis TaxID=3064524 RepID=A0ABT9B5D0_9ACTN|nr:helix-turn-helix domain-containing protein [Nocardioides sp. WY-20]MDO7868338.1 helix-turn-helix domain-containing protein [Nocardioides sp. WY-20]
MTGHSLAIGGRDVSAYLRAHRRDLGSTVVDVLVAEIPVYARLPEELLRGDVRRVVTQVVGSFVDALSRAGEVTEEELRDLTESALRRAEEGVPMGMILAAYFRGTHVCFDAVTATATEADLRAVIELNRAILRFMEHVTAAVAAGYEAHTRTTMADRAVSSQLLTSVIADPDVAAAAQRAGVVLPPAFVAIELIVAEHPDESEPHIDARVVTRRKVRRVRDEVERHCATPVHWLPSTHDLTALVEYRETDLGEAGWGWVRRMIDDVVRAAAVPVHAGIAIADPARTQAALTLAAEVVEVAFRTGRPAGAYRLADVALDYQLSHATPAQALLAAALDPLADEPHLRTTLETFLAAGLNRRRTATQLGVHPNTVDNRLRRIADLTGLDATRGPDLPMLAAALTARQRTARIT